MTTFASSPICLLFFLREGDKDYERRGRRGGEFCGWLHLCQAQFCGQVLKKEKKTTKIQEVQLNLFFVTTTQMKEVPLNLFFVRTTKMMEVTLNLFLARQLR
jgi:hypothetical protein